MTQPETQQPSLLVRRIGILPVWLWMVILIGAAVVIIRWRKNRAGASTSSGSGHSSAINSSMLHGAGSTLYTWPGDVFVRVESPVPGSGGSDPTNNSPDMPPKTTTATYTIKAGDTLSKIAAKFGIDATTLYNLGANKTTIDAAARSHGQNPSINLIYPGTVLAVPDTP